MIAVLALLLACVSDDPGDTVRSARPDTPPDDTAPDDTAGDDSAPDDTAPDDTARDTSCDTALAWYVDADHDGHGDPERATGCDDALGASAVGDDCDDTHARVYPGAPELPTSGRDDDCDGLGGAAAFGEFASWKTDDNPEDAGAETGYAVAVGMPGDLDGDGFADLVVLDLSYDDGTGSRESSAGVFRGPLAPSSDPVYGYDADAVLRGTAVDELTYVAGAGDIDGDGDTDLLLGGPGAGTGSVAYLLRGPVALGAVDLPTAAQAFTTPDASRMARGIGPGDLDGDGLADVVLAAYGAGGGAGEVYVLRGPVAEATPEEAGTVLRGDDGARFGVGLEPLGDLDGDGLADFAVASASVFEAHLVLDLPTGTAHPADAGVTVVQDADDTVRHHPLRVNPVGDVNGDGHADAGFSEESGTTLLVLFGPFGAEASIDLATAWDVAFVSDNGGVAEPDVGYAAPLGDWDGDGHEDLALANADLVPEALREDDGCSDGGYNYCTFGAVFLVAGPVATGVHDLEATADRIGPEWPGGGFGDVLAAGSDLDADGFPDLVVGQPDANLAYVLFGGGGY